METVVVVQWRDGFSEVSDGGTGRRREIPWPARDVVTEAAAQAVGSAVLDTLGVRDSVSTGAEAWPTWPTLGNGHNVPGWDGTSSLQRLVARRIGMDANGYATCVPTFSSPEEEVLAAQRVAIGSLTTAPVGRASAGMSAQSDLAKTVPTGALSPPRLPSWNTVGGIIVSDSPLFPISEPMVVTMVEMLVEPSGAPSDDITIAVYVSGSSVVALTLPQGETSWTILGSLLLGPGQTLQFRVTSIGTNTVGDLEDLQLTIVPTAATAALRVAE